MTRIEELTKQIEYHNNLYYNKDAPEISDADYDNLVRELRALDPEAKILSSIGGSTNEQFSPHEHAVPMLSLGNAFAESELGDFLNKSSSSEYHAELKLDGLALSLTYRDGYLWTAATRGDGKVGEDVTLNAYEIETIPRHLKGAPSFIEIRGEVIMPKSVFEELNKERIEHGIKPFANCRNAAAGSVRQLDPAITRGRRLMFLPYGIGGVNGAIPSTVEGLHKQFRKWGFGDLHCPWFRTLSSMEQIELFIIEMKGVRPNLNFDIDGLVFKVNSFEEQKKLGVVGKTPRHSIAYKFPPEEARTVLEAIDIQIGRTGAATPVARLKPVYVGGTTVTNCTLHNEDEIRRKNIRVGDTIIIRRAGDVVPEILGPVLDLRPKDSVEYSLPKACPICSGPLFKPEGETIARCTAGSECKAQRASALFHAVGRNALDMEGFGEVIMDNIVEKFPNVIKPYHLYMLRQDHLMEVTGAGNSRNLDFAIRNAKAPKLEKFLFAMGIRHVGQSTSRDLAKRFKTIEAVMQASYDDLIQIPDVGPTAAKSFVQWTSDNPELLEFLNASEVVIEPYVEKSNKLADKVFVISGSMEIMPRNEWQETIIANGGAVAGSVSAKTTYLVAGEGAGSKLDKAKKLNIEVITEEQLNQMVEGE